MEKKTGTSPTRWRRSLPRVTFRAKRHRWLRVTAVLAVIVTAFHLVDKCSTSRAALRVKYTPTVFPRLTPDEQAALKSPRWQWAASGERARRAADNGDASPSYSRQGLLEGRDAWKHLGSGFEGDTFRHGDDVVKVYRREQAPFRNCVPGWEPELRWPTEIAASVVVGGMVDTDDGGVQDETAAFLPVVDYFLSPGTDRAEGEWHFVTPFLPGGTLVRLAQRLRESTVPYTARDLDAIYRPSLDRLLQALDMMHTKYDLCHDDLKLDNIFLGGSGAVSAAEQLPMSNTTTHWILGDLGNVRERGHPYHTSVLWTSRKSNAPDCRANDVSRLMKTYVDFLRSSVDDVDKFNTEFFDASQPWSRLFWSVWDGVMGEMDNPTARTTLERSAAEYAPSGGTAEGVIARPLPDGLRNPLYGLFLGRSWMLDRAAREVLRVSAGEWTARAWGLVPLLGVPYSSCHCGDS